MRTKLMCSALAAMVAGGAAIAAAPGQARPGEPTRAEVWVQNRSAGEAIPIAVKEIAGDQTLKVAVLNGETAAGAPGPLRVRAVPPAWSYRTERIPAATDPAGPLSALGAQGWETTGIVWPSPGEPVMMNYLLKRER